MYKSGEENASLPNFLKEAPVFLSHDAGFFESPGALFVETPEVVRDAPHIGFEIHFDDVGVVAHKVRGARNDGRHERVTEPGRRIVLRCQMRNTSGKGESDAHAGHKGERAAQNGPATFC